MEGLRGNHMKFRPHRKPVLSSLKRARACKYRGIRNLYRAMYARLDVINPPPPPPQRPEEQTPKTAETHESNPCASINMSCTCTQYNLAIHTHIYIHPSSHACMQTCRSKSLGRAIVSWASRHLKAPLVVPRSLTTGFSSGDFV